MKILNLYGGLGGNRKLWGATHQVTSVESNPEIAKAYVSFFPDDTVVVGDAHSYLEANYSQFDFIWSSPPCPTHGQYRFNVGFRCKGYSAVFPNLELYEEILFLQHYFRGLWVVENVKPYYTPLVEPSVILQRHLFWSNFEIPYREFGAKGVRSKNKISDYAELGFDISSTNIKNKRQALRNCVDFELGGHVLSAAVSHKQNNIEGENTSHNNASLPLFQQQA